MRRFLKCDLPEGIVETHEWEPNCWVNIEHPDQEDIALMLDRFKIPRDFLDSVSDPDERPRMETSGQWTLTIIRIPLHIDNHQPCPYTTVPMGIIVKGEVVVTVCMHRTALVPDFINHTRQRQIKMDTEPDFILRLIYSSTFWFLRYLKEINDRVVRSSDAMRRSIRNDQLIDLMDTQKVLVYFNTSIKGNELLIDRVQNVYEGQCDTELLENVRVEIRQAANTVDVYTNILSGVMDSYASIISNNVNDIMRKMTGVSIVLMFPTLIASFYGMNVAIRLSDSPYAFLCIILGSISISIILYFILRKIHWL